MKKVLIGAVIVIIIVGVIILRFVLKQKTGIEEAVASSIKPVEVIKVRLEEIRSELQLSGTIEPDSRVRVFPKVAGEIIEMRVDEGSRVKKDQRLAVIEHEELELQMRQAEAAYRAAETAYEQTKKLAEIRVRTQITQARTQFESAEVSLQQVKDLAEIRTISQIEGSEAGLASLQANLEKIKSGAREEDRKQAEAAVNQAKANLANSENDYNRLKKLFESGAISKQLFEGGETQLDVAQAQHDIAIEQMRLIDNGAREEDIQAMEAQVKQAEAGLKLAHAQAETETWEKDQALAELQVEAARAALEATEALETAKSWEAEIISAETAKTQAKAVLDLAQKRLNDATITAPITGIVSKRYLDQGGMASPTAPIFELVNMDIVKATVSVIESDLGKLKLKDKGQIQVDALPEPVDGEISLISPTLDPASRAATVEFTIENADMRLKPGMFAKVTIPVEIHENAILIPRSAVIEDRAKNTRSVFIVKEDISERRDVELGLSQGSNVEIISGLSAGDMVVTAGQYSLKDNEKVMVVGQ
ncbi:efflux RND transporter periplasmic adaptor subunit [Candidatus Poribacteria bacterium]|nr:efflux RND transporter periplasmic adaptor subunit [Candidatus Poribacteria bacterium]